MLKLTRENLNKILKSCDYKVYISCIGENGFPNVSVREVEIGDNLYVDYIDNDNSRTVQLMRKSPNVLVNALDMNDPYHGYKIKGKAEFHQVSDTNHTESEDDEPVKVTIQLHEWFPY